MVSEDAAGKSKKKRRSKSKKKKKESGHLWRQPLTIRGSSIVVGDDSIFLAGIEDKIGPADNPWKYYDGLMGAKLIVYNRKDGKQQQKISLKSAPVFDGMSSANNKLFISCIDGSIICIGE